MSGPEVTGGISAVIAILDASLKVWNNAQRDLQLSETFKLVVNRLPVLRNTLRICHEYFEPNHATLPTDVAEGLVKTIKSCQDKAEKLRTIFQKTIPGEHDQWYERYRKVAKRLGQGSRVEELMTAITEDTQRLVNYVNVKSAQPELYQRLDELIEQLAAVEPSLPSDDVASQTFNAYSEPQNVSTSISRQHNSSITGSGTTHNYGSIKGNPTFNFVTSRTQFAGEVIILVIGETGAGKSRLIKQITGSANIDVGHSLTSETRTVEKYSVVVQGRQITLVDTPGFDDTVRDDVQLLEEISRWLTYSYQSRERISSIMYLHDINQVRMRGTSIRNLNIFANLIGFDSYDKILLVTTKWDLLRNVTEGEHREKELTGNFWKSMIEKGSRTARSSGDRSSALAALHSVVFGPINPVSSHVPLAIQTEIVDEHRTLDETSAGKVLTKMMTEMIGELEQRYKQQLSQLRDENEKMRNLMQAEKNQMHAEINHLRDEQEKLKTSEVSRRSTNEHEWNTASTIADVEVSVDPIKSIALGPPPPYSPRATSSVPDVIKPVIDTVRFSLQPVHALHTLITPMARRALRPRLRKNYSRIEWSCGDLLYGDYIEKTPGSLRSLAAKLGGRVISGPAFENNVANASGTPPKLPLPASSAGSSNSNTSTNTSGQQSGSSAPVNPSTASPSSEAGVSDTVRVQQATTTNVWLEICIRSGADTFMLGEIDVSGVQTDESVFFAIRNKYASLRKRARLLGRFAYRVPSGGITVKFRKDKFISSTGDPATAAIMQRPSMPSDTEATRHQYLFVPMPMDEPAMDTDTFNHYFHKPHLAERYGKWITRFPQLHNTSLYFGTENLAIGWGFEITEKRNWSILVCANLLALLVSGLSAVVSVYMIGDRATGVAIGAWLTAVQTLIITTIFWHWSNH